jgi:hypothetical protein
MMLLVRMLRWQEYTKLMSECLNDLLKYRAIACL